MLGGLLNFPQGSVYPSVIKIEFLGFFFFWVNWTTQSREAVASSRKSRPCNSTGNSVADAALAIISQTSPYVDIHDFIVLLSTCGQSLQGSIMTGNPSKPPGGFGSGADELLSSTKWTAILSKEAKGRPGKHL